jgi:dachs
MPTCVFRCVAGVLGIPFLDVVRVLAAVLLLGNLQFHENNGTCETHEAELKAVSGLLGVTPASLLRGLTMRTHNVRGQLVKSMCDANMVGISFRFDAALRPIRTILFICK